MNEAPEGPRCLGQHPEPGRPQAPAPFDLKLYKAKVYEVRNVVERASCRLKGWRRFATPYDKLVLNYRAAVQLFAMRAHHLVKLIS